MAAENSWTIECWKEQSATVDRIDCVSLKNMKMKSIDLPDCENREDVPEVGSAAFCLASGASYDK
jgi:hypothetical protein